MVSEFRGHVGSVRRGSHLFVDVEIATCIVLAKARARSFLSASNFSVPPAPYSKFADLPEQSFRVLSFHF